MSENLADVASMYIPFPRPVPVPTQDVDSPPVARICFNESWLPYVLGALKSLARPETWDAGESTRELAVMQAHSLLTGVDCFDSGCSGFESINWYGNVFVSSPYRVFYTQNFSWQCYNNLRLSHVVVDVDPNEDIAYFGMEYFSNPQLTLSCGVRLPILMAAQIEAVLPLLFVWSTRDCFNINDAGTLASGTFVWSNRELKRWSLSSFAPFILAWIEAGSYTCGQA